MTNLHASRPSEEGTFLAYGLRCLRAPNRYRKMLDAAISYSDIRDEVMARQKAEFPWARPLGLDIHPGDFDVMLIWGMV